MLERLWAAATRKGDDEMRVEGERGEKDTESFPAWRSVRLLVYGANTRIDVVLGRVGGSVGGAEGGDDEGGH